MPFQENNFLFFKSMIIYEDNHLLVINKPNKLAVQNDGSKLDLHKLGKNYIKVSQNKPGNIYLAMVHRLDQAVSGVLIFAKTSKAAQRLSKQFKMKNSCEDDSEYDVQLKKVYFALVTGSFQRKEMDLKNYILKKNHRSVIASKGDNAKLVKLFYKVIYQKNDLSFLKIHLKTGYYHQIRVQLKNIGHPIIGDSKYGSKYIISRGMICLHCCSLAVLHPVTKEQMCFKAKLPDFWYNHSALDFHKYFNFYYDHKIYLKKVEN